MMKTESWGLFSLIKRFIEEEYYSVDHHRWEDLPEGIIDHIQSFLPSGDTVRSSVLCKSWLHAYSTSPTLNFQQSLFVADDNRTTMSSNSRRKIDWMQKFAELFTKICSNSPIDGEMQKFAELLTKTTSSSNLTIDGRMQKFAEYLGNTLARYHKHRLPIKTLHLSIDRFPWGDREFVSLVQRWFEIAIESGLVILDARMHNIHGELTMPLEIFSCKTLQQLKLDSGLEPAGHISFKTSTSTMMMIRCHSLRKLELWRVDIPEELIHSLFSACPLIEDIVLDGCIGFRNLLVSGDVLHHLRSFEIMTIDTDDQSVDIDSSLTLRSFKFAGHSLFRPPVLPLIITSFKISASPNMKILYLGSTHVTNSEFTWLMSGFPLLEDLCLESCYSLVEIDIKSDYLQKLKIVRCKDVRQVKLDAPNLVDLSLDGDDANIIAGLSLRGITPSPQVKSYLAFDVDHPIDHSLLLQLREVILETFLEARVTIRLFRGEISPDINLDVLRGKPPLCSNVVETLSLIRTDRSCPVTHSTIMDVFFSIFRPKYLCLLYDRILANDGFFRFVLEQLIEKTYPLRCFCGGTDSRDDQIFPCWRHHLNGVQQIDYLHVSYSTKENRCYKPIEVPWRSLFDGSVRLENCSYIRLTLDWS